MAVLRPAGVAGCRSNHARAEECHGGLEAAFGADFWASRGGRRVLVVGRGDLEQAVELATRDERSLPDELSAPRRCVRTCCVPDALATEL